MKKKYLTLILMLIIGILFIGFKFKKQYKTFTYIIRNDNPIKIEANLECRNNICKNGIITDIKYINDDKNIDLNTKSLNKFLDTYNRNYITNNPNDINNISTEELLILEDNLKEYIVTFNTDGGNYILNKKIKKNNKVMKPNNPIKKGYRFVTWNLDNKEYDFNFPINKNITLNAIWEKIENEVIKPQPQNPEISYPILPSPVTPNPVDPVNPKPNKPMPRPGKPFPLPKPIIIPGLEEPKLPVPRPVPPKLEIK